MWPAKTYTFSPSTTISSGQLNQNFDDLLSAINTAMPSGAMIVWDGLIADIPAGWYICDGNNGTTDMRGKFILGAGGDYAVNDEGGAETHLHAVNIATGGGSAETVENGSNATVAGSAHTHAVVGNTANGSSMPPYLAKAWIRKS